MRIRKNASKVLGSVSVYAATFWPPSPAMTAAAVAGEAEGLIVCELNCSPWDVMLMDNNPNSCSFLANPKEEDESEGILGKTEKEEEPIYAITSTAAELTVKEIKEIEEKRVKRKKNKDNKEKASAELVLITHCKKSDGKGWHCKRPAQIPHSFCSYHLAQTRAYSSSHRASADHASEAATAAETRAEGGDSNNNLYYYYYYDDGFGPWRRGRALISAEVREEEKEDGRVSMDRDDDDNVVAGGDAYDLECFDEDDDDNDCNSMSHQHKNCKENGKKNEVDQLEKKRMIKKRGRRPLKSRSLKSLL